MIFSLTIIIIHWVSMLRMIIRYHIYELEGEISFFLFNSDVIKSKSKFPTVFVMQPLSYVVLTSYLRSGSIEEDQWNVSEVFKMVPNELQALILGDENLWLNTVYIHIMWCGIKKYGYINKFTLRRYSGKKNYYWWLCDMKL